MKRNILVSVCASLLCLSSYATAKTPSADTLLTSSPYRAQLFTAAYLQNPQNNFATLGMMIPLWQNSTHLDFVQLQQQSDFTGHNISSLDLASRWLDAQKTSMYTIHFGVDQQKDKDSHTFQQINIGTELRTLNWHLYSNAYLAIDKNYQSTTTTPAAVANPNNAYGFSNLSMQSFRDDTKPLSGIDFATGYTIWKRMNAQLYLGGYYYSASHITNVSGMRTYFDIDLYNAFNRSGYSHILNRITFVNMLQHDNINKTVWYSGLKFSFTLGKQQHLTGLQQYMQYPIARDYTIRQGTEHTETSSLMTNADGSAVTIGYATDADSLDNAITHNANIIAVKGSIGALSTLNLHDNQILTGGQYTLSNGTSLELGSNGELTAANGETLIRVAKNNTIEDITLNADKGTDVIANDLSSSIGHLRIQNVVANAAIKLQINDNSTDSQLDLLNNTLNMGDVNNTNAVNIDVNAGSATLKLDDNKINFGDGDHNQGIHVKSDTTTEQTVHININSINNNSIHFGSTSSSDGIFIYNYTRKAKISTTINQINNNTVSFGNGGSNDGIFAMVGGIESGEMSILNMQNNNLQFGVGNNNIGFATIVNDFAPDSILHISNLLNNEITFSGGTNLAGFSADVHNTMNKGKFIMDTVYGNNISFIAGGPSQNAFSFTAADTPESLLIVNVNDNGRTLANVNNNAKIKRTGNVTINPN